MKAIHIIVTSLTLTLMLTTSALYATAIDEAAELAANFWQSATSAPHAASTNYDISDTYIAQLYVSDTRVMFTVKHSAQVPNFCGRSDSDRDWIALPDNKNRDEMIQLLLIAKTNANKVFVRIQGECITEFHPLKFINVQ